MVVDQIFLEVTNKCSACCTTCCNRYMKRERGVMDVMRFRALVDQIAQKQLARLVHLYGLGEPYLTPRYVELCRYAIDRLASQDISTNIITNGMLVTEIPEGVSSFVISFNAGRKETYERITGLDFDRTVSNVRRLHDDGQFKRAGRVEIHMLVSEDTKDEIADFASLFGDLDGVVLRLAYKYDNQRGTIPDRTLGPYRDTARVPCHYVLNVLNIQWDGRVTLCPHDEDGQVVLGDAFTQPLHRIAASPVRQSLMVKHVRGQFDGICTECNFNVPFEGKYVYLRGGAYGNQAQAVAG